MDDDEVRLDVDVGVWIVRYVPAAATNALKLSIDNFTDLSDFALASHTT